MTESVVKQFSWPIIKSRDEIPAASTHLTSFTHDHWLDTLGYKNCRHTNTKLFLLRNLCPDVLLGRDFFGMYYSVEVSSPRTKAPFSLWFASY